MKKSIYLLLFVVFASSCATIQVSSDFDKTVKFADYKTYNFTQEALALPVDDLNKNRIITAVEEELKLKGFTKSETPDVLVNIALKTETKQTATATNTGGYYGYGYGGYRYGYGGGFSTTTINYDTYQEGTLFVEMIDPKKLELVWQGRGNGTLNPDATAKKREENIKYAIKKIFYEYPPKSN